MGKPSEQTGDIRDTGRGIGLVAIKRK